MAQGSATIADRFQGKQRNRFFGLYCLILVWCFILIDDDSETLSGQPLGACRREWQALSKARNNADGLYHRQ
jgi:hypothetical protein